MLCNCMQLLSVRIALAHAVWSTDSKTQADMCVCRHGLQSSNAGQECSYDESLNGLDATLTKRKIGAHWATNVAGHSNSR